MTDVNDRTQERYEPSWEAGAPQGSQAPRNWRRWLALAIAARVLGAGALVWGLFRLWGPAAAAIAGGLVLLRVSRFGRHRRFHHRMDAEAGPRAGRPRFHFGCGSYAHSPFRQPMV